MDHRSRRLIAAALLALGASAASAQSVLASNAPPLAMQIANGSVIKYGSTGQPLAGMARTFATGPLSGTALATETGLLGTPAGQIGINAARTVTAAGLATGIAAAAGVAGAGYAGWQVGSAIANWMGLGDPDGGARVFPTPNGWRADPGAEPTTTAGTEYGLEGVWFPSVGAAQAWVWSRYQNYGPVVYHSPSWSNIGVNTYRLTYSVNNTATGDSWTSTQDMAFQVRQGTVEKCEPYIDFFNPNYSNGSPSKGPDGKCPTGQYTVPKTPQEAADLIAAEGHHTALITALEDALEKGVAVPATSPKLSGIASKAGQPTTKTETTAGGTKTTTTSPTYHYTYNGDTITWNITNNTTITNPDGTTETITEDKPPVDERTECEKNPDSAGCAELDTPESEAIEQRERQITYAPDSGWGADNGTCPAVVHTQLVGAVDPFGLFCTYLSGIRFAVIGTALMLAAFIIIGRTD